MAEDLTFDETEEEDNIVTLVDDEGNEVDFYHIGTIEHNSKWYCIFQLAEPTTEEEEDEVAIYELVGEEPDQTLQPIDDETVMEEVFEAFLEEFEKYDDGSDLV